MTLTSTANLRRVLAQPPIGRHALRDRLLKLSLYAQEGLRRWVGDRAADRTRCRYPRRVELSGRLDGTDQHLQVQAICQNGVIHRQR